MSVNSVNNILYMKEAKLELDGKKPERSKVQRQSEESKGSLSKNVQEVERENQVASNPSIENFEQAKEVLSKIVNLLDKEKENSLLAQSGKPIDQDLF
jgi:hypothetical protein